MKDTLMRLPTMEVITKMHSIKKEGIILDSIVIYGLDEQRIDRKVNYQLHIVDDNIVIYPMDNYEKYLFRCDRVLSAENITKITTLADEYKIFEGERTK